MSKVVLYISNEKKKNNKKKQNSHKLYIIFSTSVSFYDDPLQSTRIDLYSDVLTLIFS